MVKSRPDLVIKERRRTMKCKYLREYKNTPNMRYDCDRIYEENDCRTLNDMIHFNDLKRCEKCEYRKEAYDD